MNGKKKITVIIKLLNKSIKKVFKIISPLIRIEPNVNQRMHVLLQNQSLRFRLTHKRQ